MRKASYADGKLLVEEFRKIVDKAMEGGVTKTELALLKQDMTKALKDNPDARAEITMISQLVMSNKEIIKTVVLVFLTAICVIIFLAVFNSANVMALLNQLLALAGLG